jgi:HK97 family phage prohead protease
LLRSDLLTRYQAYQIAIQNNFELPSEARALEDLPPIPGSMTSRCPRPVARWVEWRRLTRKWNNNDTSAIGLSASRHTERRSVGLTDFELRAEGNTLAFRGTRPCSTSGTTCTAVPTRAAGPNTSTSGAFDRTLSAKPDVVLNINHGEGGTGLPLARTTSGTLELRTDKKGLEPRASLDLRDPDVQALQVKVERGDVDQMSFAFRTIRQEWNDDEEKRTLLELSLDRGDVSIVTNGANPKTSVQLRDMIVALANMDPEEAAAEDAVARRRRARPTRRGPADACVVADREDRKRRRRRTGCAAGRRGQARLSIAHARRLAELDAR